MTDLDRARATGTEQIDIRVTKSGRFTVHLVRPNGHSAVAQADTHAACFAYVAILRAELDSPGPNVRGPAADRQTQTETGGIAR